MRMTNFKKLLHDKQAKSPVSKKQKYVLELFVAGMLENSVEAIKNLNEVCELYLKNNYELSVIDIYQQPGQAITEQVIAVPVLIIKHPLPEKRLIGDLSDTQKVLEVLNIKQQ